jgi:serine/threonine protein kinase
MSIKIIDFNKSVMETSSLKPLDIQTLYYTPPEIILGHRDYNSSVDVWAAGCILYELLTSKHLFNVFHKDSIFEDDTEASVSSDSVETYDHLAMLHLYHAILGPCPESMTDPIKAECSHNYFSKGKLIGTTGASVPQKKHIMVFNTVINVIFDRTFKYNYHKRLTVDEYWKLHSREQLYKRKASKPK